MTGLMIDRSTWGEGPWETELDRVEWEHAGLPCLANRNSFGAWCGYAAVPPGHALHGQSYHDVNDVEVHGGLTYSDKCRDTICHVPKPGESDNVWWFGFDCGHAWDLMPGMDAYRRTLGFSFFGDEPEDGASYRTLDYVQRETNALAEQLAARSGLGNSFVQIVD